MKNHGLLYLCVVAFFLQLFITRYAASSAAFSSSSETASNSSAATVQYHRWIPTDEHPCNIRRVSLDQLPTVFAASGGLIPPLYHEPLVIVATAATENNDHRKHTNSTLHHHHRHHSRNAVFRHKASLEHILDNFPDHFNVTLSSSNQFSERRRSLSLATYLQETVYLLVETLPEQLANESWYLFGETYTDEWMHGLLRHYELPPCRTCQPAVVALSFGIGNRGSGVQWHTHGPGFSEALHGRKHWVLYPPHQPPRELHKDQSSRSWMEHVYPHLGSNSKPYECTCTSDGARHVVGAGI
jgi:hypothetical protein